MRPPGIWSAVMTDSTVASAMPKRLDARLAKALR
jgi:hypothetical protein